jgi:LmbE family N-acetylglucosaminyl deacetylase
VKLLIIGAHSDDAEIACGGTIAKAVASGHEVRLLVLSHSAFANYDGEVRRTRDQALTESVAAGEILGLHGIETLDYPTADVPYGSEIVGRIEEHVNNLNPDVILAHWPNDTHQDHRRGALASLAAARWYPSVVMFEPMMPSGRSYVPFRPQLYVDVTGFVDQKVAALKAHVSQYERFGDDWIEAVQARCRLRGFEMGVRYAEAFEAVRLAWM